MISIEEFLRMNPTENEYVEKRQSVSNLFLKGNNLKIKGVVEESIRRIYPVPQSMHEYKICECSRFGLLFISVIILY
jgi:hypothetical protein